MRINNSTIDRPVAVVGQKGSPTAQLLRKITPYPVVELTPCQAVMGRREEDTFRAVVVENFEPRDPRALSGCAVARWVLARRADVTVVALDDAEGRRLAGALPHGVFAYSDGRPQANLTAKNVRLLDQRLEFEALTDEELLRVRVPRDREGGLYANLAALAAAVALGVPLREAAERLGA